jgi:Xaa-Pro aminopeptidase
VPADRLTRVRARLEDVGVDALLINRYEHRRWVSGVTAHDASPTATAGWVIVTADRAILLTSFLYYGQAAAEADGVEVLQIPAAQRLHETGAAQIRALGVGRVGFEAAWLTVRAHDDLTRALDGAAALVPLEGVIEPLRAVKDAGELALTRVAVDIADRAMEALFGELRPGMTEAEAAWFLEAYMRTNGAEGMAFEPGVAAGPNSAVPHHKPGDRPIRAGEPIWIDIGAKASGYCSDVTRTVLLGQPDDQYRRIWTEVLEAQRRALDFVRAGRTGQECDAVPRDYLASVGLGEAFGHGLGHGVGLEIHEEPRLTRFGGPEPLQPGMLVTVEPGAYIEGWGGVRHEELTLVTDAGLEILTRARKPLTL